MLNSITRIEEYIVNSLLASPDVPLDVNVVRLADAPEKEGVIVFAKSISVRFTGSNTETINQQPLVIQRTLDFELEISCQSQQSQSGHDYATYLLGACARTLLNRVPANSGYQVITPLTLERESFSGLTDSGHFVYNQTWSVVIEEVMPTLPIDPCVARGVCAEYIWPQGVGNSPVSEGEVVALGNKIYQLKPPEGLDCLEYGGTVPDADSGDLVATWDNTVVYLTAFQREDNLTFIVKELEDTTDILVTVRGSNGVPIRSDVFCYTGRTLLSLYMFLTNQGKLPEKVLSLTMPYAQQAVIVNNTAVIYKDPMDPEEIPLQARYGNLVFVDPSVTLSVGDSQYVRSFLPQTGLAWLSGDSYRILSEYFFCEGNNA